MFVFPYFISQTSESNDPPLKDHSGGENVEVDSQESMIDAG